MNNEEQRKNINLVKSYIDAFIGESRNAKAVEYIESEDDENNHYLEAVLDCAGYYATITYKSWGLKQGKLYFNIAFGGCDYRFTIYDIFNLFDIDDFNVYEFDNCIEEKRINKSLDKLTYIIENYSPDIRNANTNRSISKLINNRRRDMEAIYYDNISKEEYLNGEYDYVARFVKMPRDKAISNLSSRVDKGDLTLYEKRFLKYLSSSDNYYGNEKAKGKDFKTARLIVYIPIFVIAAVICIVGYFVIKELIFGANATIVFTEGYNSRGFIPEFVYNIILSALALYFAMIRIIGRPLVYLLCSADEKEIAKAKYDDGKGALGIVKKIVFPIVALALAVMSLYLSNADCIGFNENEIIVSYADRFTESYDNITVYQVQEWFNEFGSHYDSSEDYYYIIEHNNEFYEVPIMKTDSIEGKAFTEQLKKHNIEIHSVRYVNEIPNISIEQ